ncbi:MAG: alpha-galactosidase [Candidatus Omnitrophica bacterium]|nr:alpha-galactosidase [Candidatus Omnitrophota bacterium]
MKTKIRLSLAGWIICSTALLGADVQVQRLPNGWSMGNGRLQFGLEHTASGQIRLVSLRLASGQEWAVGQSETGVMLEADSNLGGVGEFRYSTDRVERLANGGVELGIVSVEASSGAKLWLLVRAYPGAAVVEFSARLENHGQRNLIPIRRIDPLQLVLSDKEPSVFTAAPEGSHGFRSSGVLSVRKQFNNWVVLEHGPESLLVGGDLGAGILQWRLDTIPQTNGVRLLSGFGFRGGRAPNGPAFEVEPGKSAETPITFLAMSRGDPDDVGNEAFRYLKRFMFLPPVKDAPLAAYCIWFTVPNSEEILLDEMRFARRLGFDVFYHDASWYEGGSTVPGMNDWCSGLGSYRASPEKFPDGMRKFSRRVRDAGMKFGIWVDPGNVDSRRVASGEIPDSWLAKIDGRVLESRHPSLAPMTELCLGDPEVVAWIKQNLTRIIKDWDLEWLKWDPSGTVSYNCNRTDHGHTRRNGAYAAWRGKMEIWSYLTSKFPSLSGFECEPSLKYSRTNPGPGTLLPGGYQCEFITGPMVSPNVWGSLYSSKTELTGDWYSASALDYHLRKHFMHGFVFGNINGMVSQRLSDAPPGYIEAFQRNLLFYKLYRHLLTEDVYHPKLQTPENWSAVQYAQGNASEAVLFVFRNGGNESKNRLKLRGLDPESTYRVTSLNERPGRDRLILGKDLMDQGLDVSLPDSWLVRGDAMPDPRYEDQLSYGSDVVLFRKEPGSKKGS